MRNSNSNAISNPNSNSNLNSNVKWVGLVGMDWAGFKLQLQTQFKFQCKVGRPGWNGLDWMGLDYIGLDWPGLD